VRVPVPMAAVSVACGLWAPRAARLAARAFVAQVRLGLLVNPLSWWCPSVLTGRLLTARAHAAAAAHGASASRRRAARWLCASSRGQEGCVCQRQTQAALLRAAHASPGEGDKKAGGSQDWDARWRDFLKVWRALHWPRRAMPLRPPRSFLRAPPAPQRSTFDPEQFVDRPQPPPGWDGRAREDIRRTENRALAPWNSPTFAKAGLLVVLATLFVFLVIVGPPPSDGRCTLPWC
jgi:hypothetical protein